MKGTYSFGQAGPTQHFPLMDHNSSLHYPTFIKQNQQSLSGSFANSVHIPSLFPSQEFNTENINSFHTSFAFSLTGFPNYSQYENLNALDLSKHNSLSSIQTNNNIFSHNDKVTLSFFPSY